MTYQLAFLAPAKLIVVVIRASVVGVDKGGGERVKAQLGEARKISAGFSEADNQRECGLVEIFWSGVQRLPGDDGGIFLGPLCSRPADV